MDNQRIKTAAQHLPHGWVWDDCSDGSGSLCDPNGRQWYGYDLSTRVAPDGFEYRKLFPRRGKWKVYEGTLDDFKQDAEELVAQEHGWTDLYDEIQDSRCRITQAKGLPQGWCWHSWSDCSGYLESPDGKHFFSYAPATICCCGVIEYEFIEGSGNWDFTVDLQSESDFKQFAEQKIRQQLEQQEGEGWQIKL